MEELLIACSHRRTFERSTEAHESNTQRHFTGVLSIHRCQRRCGASRPSQHAADFGLPHISERFGVFLPAFFGLCDFEGGIVLFQPHDMVWPFWALHALAKWKPVKNTWLSTVDVATVLRRRSCGDGTTKTPKAKQPGSLLW